MAADDDLSALEQRAYDLIRSHNGIYQSELWKVLDASSRKGSKLASALLEHDLIDREEAVHDGQRTYLLLPREEHESTKATEDSSTDDSEHTDYATLEQRAETLIRERDGLYQSQLWKELDVSSRKGSRIAKRLEDDGRIRRQEATYNGQRTYHLLPPRAALDFSLLMAGDLISPLVGADGAIDPVDSGAFSRWVLELAGETE